MPFGNMICKERPQDIFAKTFIIRLYNKKCKSVCKAVVIILFILS